MAILCRATPIPRLATASWRSTIPTTFQSWRPTTLRAAEVITISSGHTDIKELALYVEDQIKAGNWLFNLGLREDFITVLQQPTRRSLAFGIAYNIKPTTTVLSVSYARTLETPFNENLVLSSKGCSNAVLAPLLLHSGSFGHACSPAFATSSMPACNRPSARMSW